MGTMRIDILTLFPEYFQGPFTVSMVKRAVEKKALDLRVTYLRDFAEGKRKSADDVPYGGGAGMVMKPEPLMKGIQRLKKGRKKVKVILLSPQGKPLNHGLVMELVKEKSLLLVCGHYEGVDERVMGLVDEEISLGDFVLTGGEPAAAVLVDALARFLPGVVGDRESVEKDSFFNGLLDYPHYTRPHVFKGLKAPEVLLSGNHKNIERWRRKESLRNTWLKRPDLLDRAVLSEGDRELIREIQKENRPPSK
jgi:tRNA (guanine37-N1)-methyltransferase